MNTNICAKTKCQGEGRAKQRVARPVQTALFATGVRLGALLHIYAICR